MKQEIVRIALEGVNCYLGKSGENFVLFDTGGHMVIDKQFTSWLDDLEKRLEETGCKPGNLKLIVLTHGDNDHCANAAYLRDKYKTPIAMHSGDLELVENPGIEKLLESFRYKSLLFRMVFQFMKKLIRKVSLKILEDFKPFRPDILVNEGDDLLEYGFDAKILHIPGHTEGSIGVLTAAGDFIAGDTFTNTSKPDTAPNAYDFKALAASVNRLRTLGIQTVYPGHGEPFVASGFFRRNRNE